MRVVRESAPLLSRSARHLSSSLKGRQRGRGWLPELFLEPGVRFVSVSNVPSSAAREDLMHLFRQYDVKPQHCFRSARKLLAGDIWYVRLKSEDDVSHALGNLDGSQIGYRPVQIDRSTEAELAKEARLQDATIDLDSITRTVLIRGLAPTQGFLLQHSLREFLSDFSVVRMAFNENTGTSTVLFSSDEEAARACRELNGTHVTDVQVSVRLA